MSAYTEASPPVSTANRTMFNAMRIAVQYTHRTPTYRDLMASFGMSRATAHRWLRAIKDAKGIA